MSSTTHTHTNIILRTRQKKKNIFHMKNGMDTLRLQSNFFPLLFSVEFQSHFFHHPISMCFHFHHLNYIHWNIHVTSFRSLSSCCFFYIIILAINLSTVYRLVLFLLLFQFSTLKSQSHSFHFNLLNSSHFFSSVSSSFLLHHHVTISINLNNVPLFPGPLEPFHLFCQHSDVFIYFQCFSDKHQNSLSPHSSFFFDSIILYFWWNGLFCIYWSRNSTLNHPLFVFPFFRFNVDIVNCNKVLLLLLIS